MDRTKLIGPKVKALSNAMDQEMNRNTASLDLTSSQAFVLGYLVHHRGQPIYQKDVELAFDFSHPTISGILQRLESKGFVLFQVGKTDKRCKQILVTELAQQRHEAVIHKMLEVEAMCLSGMTEDEVAQLHRLLHIALKNMDASPRCPSKRHKEDFND